MNKYFIPYLLFFVVALFYSCNQAKNINKNDLPKTPKISLAIKTAPVLIQKAENVVATVTISQAKETTSVLTGLSLRFNDSNTAELLDKIKVYSSGKPNNLNKAVIFGSTEEIEPLTAIQGNATLDKIENFFVISLTAKKNADIGQTISIKEIILEFDYKLTDTIEFDSNHLIRLGQVIRQQGQDNCDTYRIPGLVTTSEGSLIAVYDARYNNAKDLQEDIDIGMSRSTDGGQTWEPMKIIMDMGEWGARPQKLNGVGDPCVLYDVNTKTIWVAALWMSGATEKDMLWWASQPGMKPEVTGQFILVKSTDDGLTWSDPINITGQIKEPGWQLLLQGPGRGISMKDGTIIFPAQFKANIGVQAIDGGQFTCHSTIVYSKDHGQTWSIGTGAKSNTTEAQVVELSDGSLMLNMRDDRNRSDKSETNGRAVSLTNNLGATWTTHTTSNSALPESNCMASIIGADVKIGNEMKHVLFFSNPNNKYQRSNMTIKASLDEGQTWPLQFQLELNEDTGYGYSCLTMVDPQTIGVLYEGVKELYFQKIAIADILGAN
ncbi:MAG: sialidase [Draconibacterium sp.]|nr:MAG: sialidase [Draconibacterium sp.]PIF06554.1 MAG: sialidase [Draconibacterium sp.]